MGWKQFARSVEAAHRRDEREATRRYRELVKHQRIAEKAASQQRAADVVAQYEAYVELLVSLHKECGQQWNWRALAKAIPPQPPQRGNEHESAAREVLETYHPGFFARTFGVAKTRRVEFEADLAAATEKDARLYAHEVEVFNSEHEAWATEREIANGVLSGNLASFGRALSYVSPFAELIDLKTRIAVDQMRVEGVALSCVLADETVPREERKLTASGKLSEKEMPAGRHWSLHQDFVCSCALRIARETMAVLPVARVVVNIKTSRLDTSTGHDGTVTLLAAHFTRSAIGALNLGAVDPSDAMKNFQVRMKFKKTTGFDAVDEMSLDEQWVTA
jgi:hypothetical protein